MSDRNQTKLTKKRRKKKIKKEAWHKVIRNKKNMKFRKEERIIKENPKINGRI